MAKKINSSWKLFKFRDRGYNPEYEVKDYTVNGVEITYFKDKKSNWIEGINSNGITLVSSALDNHSDASIQNAAIAQNTKSDKLFKEYLSATNSRNFEILKRVLRQKTIDDALNVIKESNFIGCTFLSDGDILYSCEISIPQAKLLKYRKADSYKDLNFKEFKVSIMNNLKESDFKTSIKDYSSKSYAVKTNHSVDVNGMGYTETQKGYESSISRRKNSIGFYKNNAIGY